MPQSAQPEFPGVAPQSAPPAFPGVLPQSAQPEGVAPLSVPPPILGFPQPPPPDPVPGLPQQPPAAYPAGPYAAPAPDPRPNRRLPWILAGVGLLAAVLCFGGALAVGSWLWSSEASSTTAPAIGAEAPPTVDPGEDVMAWLELPAMPPETEKASRAGATGPATQVAFINDLDEQVTVSWLNENGQRVHYQTLDPGMMYTQPTYVGHPWVVSGSDGLAIAVFQPVAQPARAVVQ